MSEFDERLAATDATMASVAGRVSSPRFVGRAAQLGALKAAYAAAASDERAATVLVAGEAGVGKTRLVDEFAQHVEGQGGIVLVGGCLELIDRALPFGPIVEALRQLHRRFDDVTLAEVLGPSRAELARLLPELGQAVPNGPNTADDDTPTARLFEHLLGALEHLGDRAPTVLVIEDLHWADRSTRDLLVFLARNLRAGRVLVVGTYRADDVHRRHPLRPVLAELERSGVARIDVERFTRAELREQLAAILGREPSAELVNQIHDRSDGNAFFAEELLAASTEFPDSLSPSLRDLLLARVDTLSEAAQHVLRIAAVIGRTAPHRLLAALAARPEPELLEGLREAVAHQVLVTDADGLTYRFRHALVQEVVYDDLLPGERVQLHARLAQLLTEQPSLCDGTDAILANELACHWYAARDQPRALQSSYQAARVAEQMYAYPEALAHAERVLELWAQVRDASDLTGLDQVGMMRYAARQAEMAGEFDRALALVRDARTFVDPAVDPVRAGLLHEREARISWMLDRGADELLPLNHEAVRLVPAEPPSEERATVLASLGQQLMLAGRNHDAIEWCEQAIAVAQEVGARVVEGHARNTLGTAFGHLGEVDAGLAQLHEARDIARKAGSWGDVARAAVNESGVLQYAGRWNESLTVALGGIEEVRRRGLDRSQGGFIRLNAAESLFELGRFDEMDEQLTEVEALAPMGVDLRRTCGQRAALHVVRGELDAAQTAIDRAKALGMSRPSPEARLALAWNQAMVLQWQGDLVAVHDIVTGVWAKLGVDQDGELNLGDCPNWADALWVRAMSCAADRAAIARARGDAAAEERAVNDTHALYDGLEKAFARFAGVSQPPFDTAILRREADAELARATGRPQPELWREIARDWLSSNRLVNGATARWREAEALLQAGAGASAAAEPLREAHTLASKMGYVPLARAVEDLARRARIDLGRDDAASPADATGLTPREYEVIGLLAQGRTNRQIADELFISTKTASVHVSNILAKLEVANRGEAAAKARTLGLVGAADR